MVILLGLLLTAVAAGCRSKTREVGTAEVPVVPVSHPVQRVVTDYVDFTGRTDAVQSVNIVPRVTGYLVQMPFKEGSEVKAGDLLFEIDPRPYQAQFDQAKSQVVLDQAQLDLAKTTLARYQALDRTTPGAVSQQALDQYKAAVAEAEARVVAQKKSLEVYKLNKEFTQVVSPIDGQVSRYYLTLGNLVNQDQTLLTTVVSLDPMYVYFDMDERTLLQIRKAISEGKITVPAEGDLSVMLGLQNEDGFPHKATINFVNNQVNSTTGSITIRGVFANPKLIPATEAAGDPEPKASSPGEASAAGAAKPRQSVPRLFSPGMFVRVRLPIGQPHEAPADHRSGHPVRIRDSSTFTSSTRRIKSRPAASRPGPCRKTASAWWKGKSSRTIGSSWARSSKCAAQMKVKPDLRPMPSLGRAIRGCAAGGRRAKPAPSASGKPRIEAVSMISRFFIDRPIFATVLSVVITLIGGISLLFLPIAQYPRITPPGVNISISYPGASAQVVADTVGAPIEQQVNGVEGMLYMSSQSGNDGTYSLTVTFDIGTDLNTAVVKVQNRVALAMPQLPTEVQNQGITIRKKTPDILMIVNFFSPNGRYDDIYLSNYATINVRDELLRVPGVSDITYQGRARLQHPLLARSAEDGGLQHYGRRRGQRDPQPEPGCAGGLDRRSRLPTPARPSSCRSTPWAGSTRRSSSARSSSRPA